MLMFSRQRRWLRFVLGALVVLGLSGPSFAGTVFTWETDDGTISFTDDAKRIPARYKLSATKKEMSPLKTYPRYTPAGRRSAVEETEQAQVLSGDGQTVGAQRDLVIAPGFDGRAISIGGSRYGSGKPEPTPDTETRVDPTGASASRRTAEDEVSKPQRGRYRSAPRVSDVKPGRGKARP
jgi:hypothetical protein